MMIARQRNAYPFQIADIQVIGEKQADDSDITDFEQQEQKEPRREFPQASRCRFLVMYKTDDSKKMTKIKKWHQNLDVFGETQFERLSSFYSSLKDLVKGEQNENMKKFARTRLVILENYFEENNLDLTDIEKMKKQYRLEKDRPIDEKKEIKKSVDRARVKKETDVENTSVTDFDFNGDGNKEEEKNQEVKSEIQNVEPKKEPFGLNSGETHDAGELLNNYMEKVNNFLHLDFPQCILNLKRKWKNEKFIPKEKALEEVNELLMQINSLREGVCKIDC